MMGSAPMMQAAPPPKKQQNKVLLFAITFGVVFLIGSVCFGSAALYLIMSR